VKLSSTRQKIKTFLSPDINSENWLVFAAEKSEYLKKFSSEIFSILNSNTHF